MLKQKQLATAVAAVLGASAAGIGSVQAGVAFFPYVANGGTVTSIVSTMNAGVAQEIAGQESLHYRLYWKAATASHSDPCRELNVYRPTSQYDINTIDLGGKFGQATSGVLFNDPSVLGYTGPSFSFGASLPAHRGYLLVDNGSSAPVAGELFIMELSMGAAWGYQAIQASNPTAAGASFAGEVTASPSQVALMPFDEITTKFLVTPIGTDMAVPRGTQYAATIYLEVTDPPGTAAYDRDELPVSTGIEKTVVCVGAVDAPTLIDAGISQLPDGGWSNLVIEGSTSTDTAATVSGAIVYKLEYGQDTFNNEPLNGIYNNGFRLAPAQQTRPPNGTGQVPPI